MIHSSLECANEWMCAKERIFYDSDYVFATLYWMCARHCRAFVWEYLLGILERDSGRMILHYHSRIYGGYERTNGNLLLYFLFKDWTCACPIIFHSIRQDRENSKVLSNCVIAHVMLHSCVASILLILAR